VTTTEATSASAPAPADAPTGPTETLAGWGNFPRAECIVRRPETPKQLRSLLGHPRGTIPRGLGRSYGDPAVNEGGVVLDMTSLDRYLAFDEDSGVLTCEAGTTLEQIIRDFAPRGFFPRITPGTKFVTVGGCIANDVHGKAHHVDGCFSSCVDSMRVLLASGEVVDCSRTERPDLFWGTFGGMGLLGVVLDVTMRLRRIESTYFHQRAIVVEDLDALLDAFETYAEHPYSVAWIDPLATGARLGKGVLTIGDHAKVADLPAKLRKQPLRISPASPLVVPFELPSFALNPATVRLLNVVLDQVQSRGAPIAHYEKFFYPLDFVGLWNRGYGRRGFTQYQFVIPLEDGPARMRAILETIATSGQIPFLNVLKKLGAGTGLLSFPFEGYTFAIDFPIRDGLPELLTRLDGMVLDAGGRIYLGKDAFCDAKTFHAMYPKAETWLEAKAKYDPNAIFSSNLARRVGLVA